MLDPIGCLLPSPIYRLRAANDLRLDARVQELAYGLQNYS